MHLILLALAPGVAICVFIFYRDRYNREPKLNLVISFLLGAASVIPAALIEGALGSHGHYLNVQNTFITAFLVVALTEELSKFAVFRLYSYTRKSFDEPLDGIVYAVVVSMGFATVENIMYVWKSGTVQVAFLRMFLSVPAHATFGVLMGYHAGKAKFDMPNRNRLLLLGLYWAVLFHGIFDFCLFLQSSPDVKDYISDGLLFTGSVISFIIAIRLSMKHIKAHRRLSQKTFKPTESMLLRQAYQHDIPLIRDLTFKIWPDAYGSLLSQAQLEYMLNMMYSEKALMQQMEDGNDFVIVYDGVEPIGFASIGKISPQTYKLHKIYILPSYQGKGAGRFVIGELIKAVKRNGGTSLQLNVNRHNKAKSFYEKIGFTVIKEEDIDIGNGYYMNDYVMEMKFK